MATISLRRAQQIVNRIGKETVFEVEIDDEEFGYRRRRKKSLALQAEVSVSIDGNPAQRIASLRENLLSKQNRFFRLLTIGTRIRQVAGEKQAQCGVTSLVTERVMLVKKQQILESLLAVGGPQGYDADEFGAQVAAMRERLSKGTTNQASAEIRTPLLTQTDRKALEAELYGTKRRLLDVEDRLAELNAANSIAISDDDEEYLRQEGIA